MVDFFQWSASAVYRTPLLTLKYFDSCPTLLYKYCTKQVYHNHVQHGRFRVGTLAEYRKAFESKGAEYGDLYEGNPAFLVKGPGELGGRIVPPQGAVVMDVFKNAYVFCAAHEYAKADHKRWRERTGCGYDLCVVLDGSKFIKALASAIHTDRQTGPCAAVKTTYRDGVIDLKEDPQRGIDLYRRKGGKLKWEKEYRLVYLDQALAVGDTNPLLVQSPGLAETIVDTIQI